MLYNKEFNWSLILVHGRTSLEFPQEQEYLCYANEVGSMWDPKQLPDGVWSHQEAQPYD